MESIECTVGLLCSLFVGIDKVGVERGGRGVGSVRKSHLSGG